MKTLSITGFVFGMAFISLAASMGAQQEKAPVQELRLGGYTILFRHGETDQSLLPREQRKPEPSPMDLANCAVQHKLNENGREDARLVGKAFKVLGIPVGPILASGYCRALETARLAFGRAEASDTLLHPTYESMPGVPAPPSFPQRMEALRKLLATPLPAGTNTVLVSHGEIFMDLIGSFGTPGEALIYKPGGQSGFTLVGRVLPKEWLAQAIP